MAPPNDMFFWSPHGLRRTRECFIGTAALSMRCGDRKATTDERGAAEEGLRQEIEALADHADERIGELGADVPLDLGGKRHADAGQRLAAARGMLVGDGRERR